jgi:hypothetical protein
VQEGNEVSGAFTVFISTGDWVGNSSSVNRQLKEIRWPADVLANAGDKAITFRVNVVLEPGRQKWQERTSIGYRCNAHSSVRNAGHDKLPGHGPGHHQYEHCRCA